MHMYRREANFFGGQGIVGAQVGAGVVGAGAGMRAGPTSQGGNDVPPALTARDVCINAWCFFGQHTPQLSQTPPLTI
jgi:TPP-dependent pyruvate/acetoin dehydrogenase alpha subunit